MVEGRSGAGAPPPLGRGSPRRGSHPPRRALSLPAPLPPVEVDDPAEPGGRVPRPRVPVVPRRQGLLPRRPRRVPEGPRREAAAPRRVQVVPPGVGRRDGVEDAEVVAVPLPVLARREVEATRATARGRVAAVVPLPAQRAPVPPRRVDHALLVRVEGAVGDPPDTGALLHPVHVVGDCGRTVSPLAPTPLCE